MQRQDFPGLETNILATLAYYKVLKWPLTLVELRRYLICIRRLERKPSLLEIERKLETLVDKGIVSTSHGFYFFADEDGLVGRRIQREKQTLRKWLLIKKRAAVLRNIPFLRAAFVSGSIALGNADEGSDLDLLVVAKQGRIWTVRAFLHFVLGVLGWRRTQDMVQDKICLNHFLTTVSLKVPFENMYNAQTYSHLLCLIDQGELFERFQRSNSWIKDYICSFSIEEYHDEKKTSLERRGWIQKGVELVLSGFSGDLLERFFSWVQRKKINIHKPKKEDERIFVGKNQLAFHPRQREKEIVASYKENLKEIDLLQS